MTSCVVDGPELVGLATSLENEFAIVVDAEPVLVEGGLAAGIA